MMFFLLFVQLRMKYNYREQDKIANNVDPENSIIDIFTHAIFDAINLNSESI